MQKLIVEQLKCYHCGEDCPDKSIHAQDKLFCCISCKLVYEILEENNLCTYYSLEAHPGLKQEKVLEKNRWSYLDDASTQQSLLDFQNEEQAHITFYIPQMHCSSCIWLLENLHKLHSGVLQSRVNFEKKEVKITYQPDLVQLSEIASLLASTGYEPYINLGDTQNKNPKPSNRRLFYQLGVAGFAFGNIMLFSLPEYLAGEDRFFGDFASIFAYLNLALGIPVYFYCAQDYLKSAWSGIKQRTLNMDVPVSLGITALFSYSVYDIFFLNGPGYIDSLAGLTFFLLVGKYFQQKTFESLSFERDYTSYFPIAITKINEGKEETINITKLKEGDWIKIRNAELIPADAILLKGQAQVDYSFVTGESIPVAKQKGEILFAGGRQVGEAIYLEVIRPASQSYLTELWNHQAFRKDASKSLSTLADKAGKAFVYIVLVLAVGTLAYWLINDPSKAPLALTSVLIVACPCVLALASPFALGHVVRILGRNKFYLKNADVVEKLAAIDTIVFDKTGTLSTSQTYSHSFSGELTEQEQQAVATVLSQSTHPLAMKISNLLKTANSIEIESFEERPGQGVTAWVNGHYFRLGSAIFTGARLEKTADSAVHVAIDGKYRGHFNIKSAPREGIKKLLDQLKTRYEIFLLSGDHDHERELWKQQLGSNRHLYFEQSPQDKLAFIQSREENGQHCLMVGDGLNDAGALKASTVGLAVSENVSLFSPACDSIMHASALHKLNQFLAFAKAGRRVILYTFGFSLVYNTVGLSLAAQGLFSPLVSAILMPLSSISVVTFTTLGTYLAAKRYGLTTTSKEQ